MSANLQHDKTVKNGNNTSTYHFVQEVPMSTYLVAIAGNNFSLKNFFENFSQVAPLSPVWSALGPVSGARLKW